MSHLLLLLSLLQVPANPQRVGRRGFDHATMVPRPRPDPALPGGTVSVLVRSAPGMKSEKGAAVFLLPVSRRGQKPKLATALMRSRTNEKGRVFLRAARFVGRPVQVAVRLGKSVRRSMSFTLPRQGGARLFFLMRRDASGRVAATEVTRKPDRLALRLDVEIRSIDRGLIFLAITYKVQNFGAKVFDPGKHGLHLPIPAGLEATKIRQGPEGTKASARGITVLSQVPTGRAGVVLVASGHLKYDDHEQPFKLQSLLPIIDAKITMTPYEKVRLTSTQLDLPKRIPAYRGMPAVTIYKTTSTGFPTQRLAFRIVELPLRSRTLARLAAAIAAICILFGFGIVLLRRKSGPPAARPAKLTASDAAAEHALDHLVALERDRLLGLVGPEDAEKRQAQIIEAHRTAAQPADSPSDD